MNGETVLPFLDVVLHAAALVVKPPNVNSFPGFGSDHPFIMPKQIKFKLRLITVETVHFADDGHTARLLPSGCFIAQYYPLDDPILIDEACSVLARMNLLFETRSPFQFANITDLTRFPEVIEIFAAKTFVEAHITNFPLSKQVQRLRGKGKYIGRTARITRTERGVHQQP
jgi:hypothetical protein